MWSVYHQSSQFVMASDFVVCMLMQTMWLAGKSGCFDNGRVLLSFPWYTNPRVKSWCDLRIQASEGFHDVILIDWMHFPKTDINQYTVSASWWEWVLLHHAYLFGKCVSRPIRFLVHTPCTYSFLLHYLWDNIFWIWFADSSYNCMFLWVCVCRSKPLHIWGKQSDFLNYDSYPFRSKSSFNVPLLLQFFLHFWESWNSPCFM